MLEKLGTPQDDNICGLMQEASKLSPEDFRILTDALDNPMWGNVILARKLNALGFRASRGMLFRHRNKECACAR